MTTKKEKFKAKRNINNIEIVSDNKHILSITIPLYIYYVDIVKNHTICPDKKNIDIDLIFLKTESSVNHKNLLKAFKSYDNIETFIPDDETMFKSYYKKMNEEFTDSCKESIFEFVKENYDVPPSFKKENIYLNNITGKQVGKIAYHLPCVVDINIIDINHRRFKIQSVLADD